MAIIMLNIITTNNKSVLKLVEEVSTFEKWFIEKVFTESNFFILQCIALWYVAIMLIVS